MILKLVYYDNLENFNKIKKIDLIKLKFNGCVYDMIFIDIFLSFN